MFPLANKGAAPATTLAIELDDSIARDKISRLMHAAESRGGIEAFVEALQKKHELFAGALQGETGLDEVLTLLETVFTARRKLFAGAQAIDESAVMHAIAALLESSRAGLEFRLTDFVAALGGDQRKTQRAAWDFGAELLHFVAPQQMPLMTRWVWDAKVQSGALREFVRGGDSVQHIAIGASDDQFEAARAWMIERLSEQGFYRDLPFLVDLVYAQAYADYVLGMSNGMGMFGSEFGGKLEPVELIAKLLGVDPTRKNAKSRIKQQTLQ